MGTEYIGYPYVDDAGNEGEESFDGAAVRFDVGTRT